MARKAYPRPQLRREKWLSLNGEWDFEFDFDNLGLKTENKGDEESFSYDDDLAFTKKINVPFCPESELSGIGYKDFINACWYRKVVRLEKASTERVILNFEASFYRTVVFVNGVLAGSHKGGYTPFSFDITDLVKDDVAEILVHIDGDARNLLQPSGKQCAQKESYGCFYTRSTGIYSTVWIEYVPSTYLKDVVMLPDLKNNKLDLELTFNNDQTKTINLVASIEGQEAGRVRLCSIGPKVKASLPLSIIKLWNVGEGNLYDLEILIEADGSIDHVSSYFGMRDISLSKLGMLINGIPVFHRLVLDQGYYGIGVYTAEDDGDFKKDIDLALDCGFNGARLHQRVFDRLYLYEADKKGFIVWGEYPSWNFDYTDEKNASIYIEEWLEAVRRDFNSPSVVLWCPMNENHPIDGRKQSDKLVQLIYEATKEADPTRPVIDTTGMWHVKTDIFDTHDYEDKLAKFKEHYGSFEKGKVYDWMEQKYDGQPFMLSEYGGFKWPYSNDGWGYGEGPKSVEEFVDKFISFASTLLGNERICGFTYTQLCDVEQEQNGLYYYSRKPKFDIDVYRRFKEELTKKAAFEKSRVIDD